ncbi:MAG: hypothetical protein NC090_05060 [Anaeroplasma bactoclasticum]|nr:hypothetical protein [Anaeroplasma bactoclasticum]
MNLFILFLLCDILVCRLVHANLKHIVASFGILLILVLLSVASRYASIIHALMMTKIHTILLKKDFRPSKACPKISKYMLQICKHKFNPQTIQHWVVLPIYKMRMIIEHMLDMMANLIKHSFIRLDSI